MDSTTETQNQVAAIVAAQTLSRPVIVAGVPLAVVPNEFSLKSLESALAFPARRRGVFGVLEADGFNKLVEHLRELERGVVDGKAELPGDLPIFFTRSGNEATISAVVNFSTWRDLKVTLSQRLSDPFKEWLGKNAQSIPQRAFATFLEERTHHVQKPDGSALLGLCRNFKANVSVRFQSVVEDANGDNSLEFIQSTEAGTTGAKGRMKVPDRITLGMPVWHGGEPVKFDAKFNYSIGDDGKLGLSFEILNLNELLTNELAKIVKAIAAEHKGAIVIEGSNADVPALLK